LVHFFGFGILCQEKSGNPGWLPSNEGLFGWLVAAFHFLDHFSRDNGSPTESQSILFVITNHPFMKINLKNCSDGGKVMLPNSTTRFPIQGN
jgi:hypothetical protein